MATFFSYFVIAGTVASLGFINPGTDTSEKVLEAFNKGFNDAKNVTWFSGNNEYTAVFVQNGIRTNITYDKDGHFLTSRRYYYEDRLPLNLVMRIKEKYKGKTIKNVTEVIQDDSITYSILLEDEQDGYVVESSSNTNLRVQTRFKKQPTP